MQNPQAKGRMDVYFKRIAVLAQSEKLESRIRFALQVRHIPYPTKDIRKKILLVVVVPNFSNHTGAVET